MAELAPQRACALTGLAGRSDAIKRLVIFDLDGTLAASKQSIDSEMGALLAELLNIRLVAVISGGDWPQFERQLLALLPASARLENLLPMPTSGTKFYRFQKSWQRVYADLLSAEERSTILVALNKAIAEAGLADERLWGERIEDRGSQITYSGLGQQAPSPEKADWDPDRQKRSRIKRILDRNIANVAVRIGGSTSIDITKPGIDKSFGMRKLVDFTGFKIEEMLFIGDALYPGGNDAPVRDAGVATIAVRDIGETRLVIETLLRVFGAVPLSVPEPSLA